MFGRVTISVLRFRLEHSNPETNEIQRSGTVAKPPPACMIVLPLRFGRSRLRLAG